MKDRYIWLASVVGVLVFIALVSWVSIVVYKHYYWPKKPVAVSPATAPSSVSVTPTAVNTTTPAGTFKVKKPREGNVDIDLKPYLQAIAERDAKIKSLEEALALYQDKESMTPDSDLTPVAELTPVVHVQRAGFRLRPGVMGAWDMKPGRKPQAELYGYLQCAFIGESTFGLHAGKERAGINAGRYLPWCENLQSALAVSHEYKAPALRNLSGSLGLKIKF